MNHLMYYSFFNKLNVQKNEEVEEVEMWKRELKKEEEIQAGQLSW